MTAEDFFVFKQVLDSPKGDGRIYQCRSCQEESPFVKNGLELKDWIKKHSSCCMEIFLRNKGW